VDDGLLISVAVTCDLDQTARRRDGDRPTRTVLRPSNGWPHYAFVPSIVGPTWQLEIRADAKYFFPLQVRYSVIADSRG